MVFIIKKEEGDAVAESCKDFCRKKGFVAADSCLVKECLVRVAYLAVRVFKAGVVVGDCLDKRDDEVSKVVVAEFFFLFCFVEVSDEFVKSFCFIE